MFAELYAVARHTPLTIIVTPRGERLQVIIVPKPGDDAEDNPSLSKPISALGTPEELDAELPAEIIRYVDAVNQLRCKIDLPIDAVDEEASTAEKKAAKKAEKKSTATPAAPRIPTSRPAAKKTAKRPGIAKESTTGSNTAPAPKKAKVAKHPKLASQKPKVDRGTREQCVEDGKEYVRLIGEAKPSRVLFVKFARTGRRYEKIWSSFSAFITEIRGEAPATTEPGTTDQNPESESPDSGTNSAATETVGAAATVVTAAVSPASAWPFPTGPFPTGPAPTTSDDDNGAEEPAGSTQAANAREVDNHSGTTDAAAAAETAPSEPAKPQPPVIRPIHSDTGMVLSSTMKPLKPGDKYIHPEMGEWLVLAATADRITVTAWTDEAPPPKAADQHDIFANT